MFCRNCGKEIDEKAAICVHCGVPVSGGPVPQNDAPSAGYAALGFFVPIVGLIMFLMWESTKPKRAKSAGRGALAGFITSVVLAIVVWVIYFVLIGMMINGAMYY